jgi:hypothetical protein
MYFFNNGEHFLITLTHESRCSNGCNEPILKQEEKEEKEEKECGFLF